MCHPEAVVAFAAVCKPALRMAPKCDKKPSMAEGRGAKGCASFPQHLKQKHSGHGRATGSKASKPKLPKDAKAAALPPTQGKAKLPQRACDATATVTISSKSSASQHTEHAVRGQDKHASPDRTTLLPLSSERTVIPAIDSGVPPVQQTGTPPAGCTTPAAPSSESQHHEDMPAPDSNVPVTPPPSDTLPLPITLLQPSKQPRPSSARQPADSTTIPADVKQARVLPALDISVSFGSEHIWDVNNMFSILEPHAVPTCPVE